MVEAEIKEIEEQLVNVKIIEIDADDVVALGCFVKIRDERYDEDVEYQIVGNAEADIIKNRISNESPLAKALLGKKTGDRLSFIAPAGEITVRVLAISR
jgi:transcription elongation factor GreA